jgi:hypothetical protein
MLIAGIRPANYRKSTNRIRIAIDNNRVQTVGQLDFARTPWRIPAECGLKMCGRHSG